MSEKGDRLIFTTQINKTKNPPGLLSPITRRFSVVLIALLTLSLSQADARGRTVSLGVSYAPSAHAGDMGTEYQTYQEVHGASFGLVGDLSLSGQYIRLGMGVRYDRAVNDDDDNVYRGGIVAHAVGLPLTLTGVIPFDGGSEAQIGVGVGFSWIQTGYMDGSDNADAWGPMLEAYLGYAMPIDQWDLVLRVGARFDMTAGLFLQLPLIRLAARFGQ